MKRFFIVYYVVIIDGETTLSHAHAVGTYQSAKGEYVNQTRFKEEALFRYKRDGVPVTNLTITSVQELNEADYKEFVSGYTDLSNE